MNELRTSWIQLKRMVGINPATPEAAQEGQVRYVRDGDVDGKFYVARRLASGTYEWREIAGVTATGADPTIANTPVGTYPGAGTTPGAVTINGNDTAMMVTFTTGTTPATGSMFKVTFATARPSSTYAVWALPQNNGASQIEAYPASKATTDFVLNAKVAAPASTSISFSILVIEV